ncbi:hypothetical protein HN51_029632 [Arachis hypogaea]
MQCFRSKRNRKTNSVSSKISQSFQNKQCKKEYLNAGNAVHSLFTGKQRDCIVSHFCQMVMLMLSTYLKSSTWLLCLVRELKEMHHKVKMPTQNALTYISNIKKDGSNALLHFFKVYFPLQVANYIYILCHQRQMLYFLCFYQQIWNLAP